jgi:hypothetical protein
MNDEELLRKFELIIKFAPLLDAKVFQSELKILLFDFNKNKSEETRKTIKSICKTLHSSNDGACKMIRDLEEILKSEINFRINEINFRTNEILH